MVLSMHSAWLSSLCLSCVREKRYSDMTEGTYGSQMQSQQQYHELVTSALLKLTLKF